MDAGAFLAHLLGFLAPAAFLALALPPLAGLVAGRGAPRPRWWLQAAAVFVAGAAVLAIGLWWFGRDGKMATYAALALATATVQWLLLRGWRPAGRRP